jgi:hypothetical protein
MQEMLMTMITDLTGLAGMQIIRAILDIELLP